MNFVKPVVLEILHALWISVWNESVILEQRRVHERWRGIFIFLSSSPANKQLTLRATTYQSVVPLFLLFSCISGTTTSFSLTHYNLFRPFAIF